jgi:ubiquinone biosynthesis protein COQ9
LQISQPQKERSAIMSQELKSKFVEILARKGWNISAMRDTAISLSLDPEYHYIIFPDGIRGALDYYEQSMDAQMLEALAKEETPKKIRDKIALALGLRIIPGHTPSLKSAWRTSDAIWRYAGDVATDFNHYTKRALLSGVYIASAKYRSRNSEEATKDYIDKALDKVISFGRLKNKLPKLEDIPVLRMFS